jgi:hypothetical protein
MNSTEQQSWSLAIKWDSFQKAPSDKIREKRIKQFIQFLANNTKIETDEALFYMQKVKEYDFAVFRHYKVIEPCEHFKDELKKEGYDSIIIPNDKIRNISEQCQRVESQYQLKRWERLF